MRKKNSFTLIELLIVVVVIGALAGTALVNHYQQKRRSEFLSALAQVRGLGAVVKNYFLTMGSYTTTANTAATNSAYGSRIVDGNYYNFRVNAVAGPSFTTNFDYHASGAGASTATYTFNSDGVRTDCSGAQCVSDW